VVELVAHIKQLKKKRTSPYGCAIIAFFGVTKHLKQWQCSTNIFERASDLYL
jgi:hypothetical protein